MKNILVLSGSPRKGGNSDILCDQFIKGADEAGNVTEKIYVREQDIGYCTACDACRNRGACVQRDDMSAILDKMVEADVIVMATPVYFYSMDAQMKTLIDRTLPRYTEIEDKDFYFIAAAAAGKAAMERTIDGFQGFTDCLPGAKVKGVVYGSGAWQKGDIRRSKAMEEAYRMGKGA
ncbi:NAD(P)H-dependent oxidoreductase [Candidatus Soleaferrea massiliensis]|uniref:NAD(P)H-dependent oxidoreductase n=1 Tax=Candidatus Soleaferrea massiliensis TaxID=1470354 RepID=UPI00058F1C2E